MFLPYVFVPAGRSCFLTSKTHRANSSSSEPKDASRRPSVCHKSVSSVGCFLPVCVFCFLFLSHFGENFFACSRPLGGSRVPPFSADPWSALTILLALLQDIIQHRFHSINVLYSMHCSNAAQTMSLIFRNQGFIGVICCTFNRIKPQLCF